MNRPSNSGDHAPISVKDPGAARAVRRLAAATGEPITEAVRIAAEERYGRLFRARTDRAARLKQFITQARQCAILDQRDAD